ncbi:hypothetical protein NQ847_06840 [Acinetobacter baumannii]|nr:hypothetical protein [Acinetobacter baumannii]
MSDIITRVELEEAKVDAKDLGECVNGNETGIVNPRYGDPYPTLPKLSTLFEALIAEGYISIDDLQQAINIAAAAGAGAEGWTDLLVQLQDGSTQRSLNTATKGALQVFRFQPGDSGAAVNTITGFSGNGVANSVHGCFVQQGSLNNENIIGGDISTVGINTPNLVDNTKTWGAHYAAAGGYDCVVNALAGICYSFHSYIQEGATHGAIWGGSYIKFIDGDYSGSIGGTLNELKYTTGGAYSFFGAGNNNKIYARFSSAVASFNCRIGNDGDEKEYSSVHNSYLSTVDGNNASVQNGYECKASKNFSFASGKYAVANTVGERAFSGGRFATTGDCGYSTIPLMRMTTTNGATQLLCSDVPGDSIAAVGINTSLTLRGMITAFNKTSGSTASFRIEAHVSRGASGGAIVNAKTITPIYNPESLSVDVGINAASYQILVTGLVSNNINWSGKLETVWARNI